MFLKAYSWINYPNEVKEEFDIQVDDDVYELLKDFNIRPTGDGYFEIGNFYGHRKGIHQIVATLIDPLYRDKGLIPHHKDKDTSNNLRDNIDIITTDEHNKIHGQFRLGNTHRVGKTLSEEHKKAIGDAARNRIFTEEELANKSKAAKSSVSLHEHLERLRIANTGRAFTDEHKKAISDAKKGVPCTLSKEQLQERGNAISVAKKGKALTDEHKKALSNRIISDEWRMNKSIAAKKFFAENKEKMRLKKIEDGIVLPWIKAKEEASKLAKNKTQYLALYKTVKGLVSNPNKFYPEWKGWNDYLSFHES